MGLSLSNPRTAAASVGPPQSDPRTAVASQGPSQQSGFGIGGQRQHQIQVCRTWLSLPWHIGSAHRGCRQPAPASPRTQQSPGSAVCRVPGCTMGTVQDMDPGAPWDRSKLWLAHSTSCRAGQFEPCVISQGVRHRSRRRLTDHQHPHRW